MIFPFLFRTLPVLASTILPGVLVCSQALAFEVEILFEDDFEDGSIAFDGGVGPWAFNGNPVGSPPFEESAGSLNVLPATENASNWIDLYFALNGDFDVFNLGEDGSSFTFNWVLSGLEVTEARTVAGPDYQIFAGVVSNDVKLDSLVSVGGALTVEAASPETLNLRGIVVEGDLNIRGVNVDAASGSTSSGTTTVSLEADGANSRIIAPDKAFNTGTGFDVEKLSKEAIEGLSVELSGSGENPLKVQPLTGIEAEFGDVDPSEPVVVAFEISTEGLDESTKAQVVDAA